MSIFSLGDFNGVGPPWQQRYQEWTDAIGDMEQSCNAAAYFDACSPDVLVDNPAGGYSTRGITTERHNVETGLAFGVHLVPTGIVTGPSVTIYEASYQNPPEDPYHCPPLPAARYRTQRLLQPSRRREGAMVPSPNGDVECHPG